MKFNGIKMVLVPRFAIILLYSQKVIIIKFFLCQVSRSNSQSFPVRKSNVLCHAFGPNHARFLDELRLISFNCADKILTIILTLAICH